MKNLVFKGLLVCVLSFGLVSCNNDDDFSGETVIEYGNLPENARNLIETNFPDASPVRIIQNTHPESDGTLYEVDLNNHFDLEFNEAGDLTDANGNGQKIPDAMVWPAVLNYTQTNYPANYIIEVDLEINNYEVELNNHIELVFDSEGNFIRVDN